MPGMDFREIHQMDLQMCLLAFPQKQLPPHFKLLELGIVLHFHIFKMNNLQKRGLFSFLRNNQITAQSQRSFLCTTVCFTRIYFMDILTIRKIFSYSVPYLASVIKSSVILLRQTPFWSCPFSLGCCCYVKGLTVVLSLIAAKQCLLYCYCCSILSLSLCLSFLSQYSKLLSL